MAKPIKKSQALELRKKGKSIKEIARQLEVAKSSVSLWCRDIELAPKQIERLMQRKNCLVMKAG